MSTRFDILRRLADGRFHSGERLAQDQGISRAAIWKQISRIKTDYGLSVFSVRGKGYRLAVPLELLAKEQIEAGLTKSALGCISRLEIKDRIDSTNSYLMESISDGIASGTVCLAEQQTAGRGRQGRGWVSPFGANIYLSIFWKYKLDLADVTGLSLAAGLAVAKSLRRLGIEDVVLKWPNDVLWENRKLAGLLLEATGEQGGPSNVVLGLGLNSRIEEEQARNIDQPWVDLSRLPYTTDISRNRLAAVLLNALLETLDKFETQGFSPLVEEWKSYDAYYGDTVRLKLGDGFVVGTHCGVNESGALLLKEAGVTKAYHGGELSLRVLRQV